MLYTNKILRIPYCVYLLLICIAVNAHNDLENLSAYSISTTQTPVDFKNHSNARLFVFRTCGIINTDRISGNRTDPFQYPWMAILQYKLENDQLEQKCLGSIITQRFILTTSYCITDLSNGTTLHSVVVGEHNINTVYDCNEDECAPPVQTIMVDRVIPHPAYNKSVFKNDIGLVRLQSLVEFNYAVLPICLPITPESNEQTLSFLNLLYWGRTEHVAVSGELRVVLLRPITTDVCNRRLMQLNRITVDATHLCTDAEESTSCIDFAGAPAIAVARTLYGPRFIQYGVALNGASEYQFNSSIPLLYTRVTPYLDWILDTCDE